MRDLGGERAIAKSCYHPRGSIVRTYRSIIVLRDRRDRSEHIGTVISPRAPHPPSALSLGQVGFQFLSARKLPQRMDDEG